MVDGKHENSQRSPIANGHLNYFCLPCGQQIPHASCRYTRHSQMRFELLCLLFCIVHSLPAGTHKFVTEGEHMQLKAITKEQSGSYECIASNDISSPDVRTVQVTVNCKSQGAGLCRDQINKYIKIQLHPGDKFAKMIRNIRKLFDDKWQSWCGTVFVPLSWVSKYSSNSSIITIVL